MAKTKILGICQHFYPEMVSTGLHMTELFSGLAAYDENICNIFCAYPIKKEYKALKPPSKEVYKNISIHRTKNIGVEHKSIFQRMVYNVLFVIKALWFTIKNKNQFDKILLTTDPPFIGVIPLIIKKLFAKPYALIIYDVYPDIAIKLGVLSEKSIISKFWTWLNKKVYLNADTLIVIGEDMRHIILKKLPSIDPSKITLIHNWSDSRQIKPVAKEENIFIKENNLEGKQILLYSGNMGRTHNIESILQASIEIEKTHPNVLFLFIGGGIKRAKVKSHISNLVSSNVKLLPFQPYEILSHVLSSAAFSWVCLDQEFTGMSVPSKSYGIMASGTPILGLLSEESEISQAIKKHDCGKVWNSKSKHSLVETIIMMLQDEKQLDLYSKNAEIAFLANYDLCISVEKYNTLMQHI